MKVPFIVVFCKGEKYLFYYKRGREDDLICTMIDYALDERMTFGWPEVRSIVRHFGLLGPSKKPTASS